MLYLSLVSKKLWWLLAGLIFLAALLLRLIAFGQIPLATYWDETAILMDAASVARTGHDVHGGVWWQLIYPSYGDYKAAPYIWLATVMVKFFGVNQAALRLPSLIAGLGTVVLAGFLASELGKSRAWSLAAMAVVATSPWAILFSRTGFEGNLGQCFLGLAILFLLKAIHQLKQTKNKHLLTIVFGFSGGIFAGLATATYFSVRFVLPVVALLIGVLLTEQRVKNEKGKIWQKIFESLGLMVVFFIPFLLTLLTINNSPYYAASNQYRLSAASILNQEDLAEQIAGQRQIAGNSLVSKLLFNQKLALTSSLAKNYAAHLDLDFLFIHGDANLRHGTRQSGLFLWPLLPFLFIGAWQLWQKNRPALLILSGYWLAALLPASVPLDVPHALRSLNALLPAALIIAFGTAELTRWIWQRRRQVPSILLASIFLILYLATLGQFFWHYLTVYPQVSASEWQADFDTLTEEIAKHQHTYSYIYVQNLDNRFFVWALANQDLAKLTDPDQNNEVKSSNFHFTQIGNLYYGDLPELLSTGALYVGTRWTIDNLINSPLNAHLKVHKVFSVYNYEIEYLGIEVYN